MRILITGAAGKTGCAVIRALAEKSGDVTIRAFVHRQEQCEKALAAGAEEAVWGDMLCERDVAAAVEGADAVYHIGPTAHPREYEIGQLVYTAAEKARVRRFVYHSVLHSNLSDLPHHVKKHRIEQMIAEGPVPYVILQPAALMQNLLNAKAAVMEKGIFPQRFFADRDVRMNLVDLCDVAAVAAMVLTESDHDYATYELCGPDNLSKEDIASAMTAAAGKPVVPQFIPDEAFAVQMEKTGTPPETVWTLLKMFRHYQEQGFLGSGNVMKYLLGRNPTSLRDFLTENF